MKTIYVITRHTTKTGDPKIVSECTYPLTGKACVDRIYTDLAVMDVTSAGLVVTDLAPGITIEHVREKTGTDLIAAEGLVSPGAPQGDAA